MLTIKQQLSISDQLSVNARIVEKLKEQVSFESLIGYKLCGADQFIKLSAEPFYYRSTSLLKYLLQNPRGVKHLVKYYSKMKKRDSVKPPKNVGASSFILVKILRTLEAAELIAHNDKGYYTARKGRMILKQCLD